MGTQQSWNPKLRLRQTKSTIGQRDGMRVTLAGLGLKGVGSEVVVANTPSIRGAVRKVIHLIRVEEVTA